MTRSQVGADAARAQGLLASEQANADSQRHEVPLFLWLGGAARTDVAVSLPLVLNGSDRTRALEQALSGASAAARDFGVSAFTIHDSSASADDLAMAVRAVRSALGPEPTLALRLDGQLDQPTAEILLPRIAPDNLMYVADPCASIEASVDATRGRLPALGLSAWKYERAALLHCLAATPPAVLLADPLLEGGPAAVRRLGAIARVLQCEVSLTATAGAAWLPTLCAHLAAAIPACHQPIELPADLSRDELRRLGVSKGMISLS